MAAQHDEYGMFRRADLCGTRTIYIWHKITHPLDRFPKLSRALFLHFSLQRQHQVEGCLPIPVDTAVHLRKYIDRSNLSNATRLIWYQVAVCTLLVVKNPSFESRTRGVWYLMSHKTVAAAALKLKNKCIMGLLVLPVRDYGSNYCTKETLVYMKPRTLQAVSQCPCFYVREAKRTLRRVWYIGGVGFWSWTKRQRERWRCAVGSFISFSSLSFRHFPQQAVSSAHHCYQACWTTRSQL